MNKIGSIRTAAPHQEDAPRVEITCFDVWGPNGWEPTKHKNLLEYHNFIDGLRRACPHKWEPVLGAEADRVEYCQACGESQWPVKWVTANNTVALDNGN